MAWRIRLRYWQGTILCFVSAEMDPDNQINGQTEVRNPMILLLSTQTDTTRYNLKGLITRRITTTAVSDFSESFLWRSLT